jgi:hypothetical protein
MDIVVYHSFLLYDNGVYFVSVTYGYTLSKALFSLLLQYKDEYLFLCIIIIMSKMEIKAKIQTFSFLP